jgi:putative ABC transport system permease protein
MAWLAAIGRRIAMLVRHSRFSRELDDEMHLHIAMRQEALQREGLSPTSANQTARRRFGSRLRVHEQSREVWGWLWLDQLSQDLRYAVRTLSRNPGFTLVSTLTLALGIGASTAIFSVAYGVSLRPLPYSKPDRLIRIHEANLANRQPRHPVAPPTFYEWRAGARSIETLALYSEVFTRFLVDLDQEPVTTITVSPAFFAVLGVRPHLGSGFKSESAYTPRTADEVALISYAAWHRLFGGRHDVIGQRLEFTGAGDNDIYRVVGVLPEGFQFGEPVDVWRPAYLVRQPIRPRERGDRDSFVVARLRAGATLDRVRAELDVISARLALEYPSTNATWTATVESLHDSVVGSFGRATWLLLAAVAVVLSIACINAGGLFLARGVRRERETAVRAALGASPGRLVTLWLVEAGLLGALGAASGLALALVGVRLLKAAAPPGLPRLDAIAIDLPTLGMAAVATLLAVVTFALMPLGSAGRRETVEGLQPHGPGAGTRPSRLLTRNVLAIAQCAGAAALVVLAVMLTRSFMKLTTFDLGWRPERVVSLNVYPRLRTVPMYRDWAERLIARLESTPGITRAAMTTHIPLTPRPALQVIARGRGRSFDDGTRWPAVVHSVSTGYFDLMGVAMAGGRAFGAADRFDSGASGSPRPDRGVAIVSETTARTLWPGESAIGQAFWLPEAGTSAAWREVVGIAEDIQFHAIGEPPGLHVFLPWAQSSTARPSLVVKGAAVDAAALMSIVRPVLEAVEPGTRTDQIATLDTLVARATAQSRFTSRAVATFGVLALVLAAIGIYGMLSYLVGARSREIGIRLALGATRGSILSSVLWRGLLPAGAGAAGGLALAFALARTFRSLFFEVEPLDIGALAGGGLLLLVVAAAAALGPARRATRVDPIVTLRCE